MRALVVYAVMAAGALVAPSAGAQAAGLGVPSPAPLGSLPPTHLPTPTLAAPGQPPPPTIPVFSTETPAGKGTVMELPPASDPPRTVDGRIDDWHGRPAGFGGTAVYSHGELVYQDHIFDAYGPDNGQDAQRLAVLDPLAAALPETYRLDPAIQYLPGEFGIPTPGMDFTTNYGDLPLTDQADLTEFRVGADSSALWLLARTTTMTAPPKTAVLVLLDLGRGTSAAAGAPARDIPFNSGIHSTHADVALLLTGNRGWVADLRTGAIRALPAGSVASNPTGYINAVEARIPFTALGGGGGVPTRFSIAAATGLAGPSGQPALANLGLGANLANVAFRNNEPVRNWWEKEQALSLYARTIDPFFEGVDLNRLRTGANEVYLPGPGYHDRLFESSPAISREGGMDGVLQHYGVYLPSGYTPRKQWPVQWWFHFRGGTAHIAATLVPRLMQDLGEDVGTIVVSPRGRGDSTWYVGKGQQDFQEVWADVHRTFSLDRNREYISGHSMGGWATYLLTILYPDRWAAGLPASAPVTQGAWTGVDFSDCDQFHMPGDNTTPCYTPANGGDPRTELTTPLLANLRWVPLAIYQGAIDELVPVSGELRQAQALEQLGYRYRFYLFPAQDHYGPPIVDQWGEGARYEHQFVRDPNPPDVTYIRSMPFEHDVQTVQSDGVPLHFQFDSAYWMSGLRPADPVNGVARFDGRSLAIPEAPHALTPEAGGPATTDQTGPYTMFGQAWAPAGAAPAARNAFQATLDGAAGVRLDTARMRLNPGRRITGDLAAAGSPLALELSGAWPRTESATVDGRPVPIRHPAPGVIAVRIPAGHHQLALRPR